MDRPRARIISALVATMLTLIAVIFPCSVLPMQQSVAHAEEISNTIEITQMTPIVHNDSGFTAKLTIANPTQETLSEGSVHVLTNHAYEFVSRTDMQQWAEGVHDIATTDELGTVHVPQLQSHERTEVTFSLPKNSEQLALFTTWGPRPLDFEYESQGEIIGNLHTFVTRAQAGTHALQSDPLHVSIALPLFNDNWQTNTEEIQSLIRQPATVTTTPTTVVTLSAAQKRDLRNKAQLTDTYPQLQVIADPYTLEELGTARVQGVTQPAQFDITSYAAMNNPSAYETAGINERSWCAQTGVSTYRAITGQRDASVAAYAWQGKSPWTLNALAQAQAQGYGTVIATHGFDDVDDTTAHTGTYKVPINTSEVTVLAAQPMLTNIAQGNATSDQADAEHTLAGRLARFAAQSAFYQMEEPYSSRDILVALNASTDTNDIQALMQMLHDADWISLSSLSKMAQAQPYASGDEARHIVEQSSLRTAIDIQPYANSLRELSASRKDMRRFLSSITPQSSNEDEVAERKTWQRNLFEAHDTFALLAMSEAASTRTDMTDSARTFANTLIRSIHINSSESVNVVSETATLPITVSNELPYPVQVRVSSKSDSMEIVTSRFAQATVGPHSEAQVSFAIRVATSGTAIIREQLVDTEGKPYGAASYTSMSSSLQISDKSGVAFIVVAVILGIIGLWRQIRRKKDDDE